MKSIDQYLASYFTRSHRFGMADCYTFTLQDGTVLRYTSWDRDLTLGGNTFKANDALIERSRITTAVGMQVGELGITVYADNSKLIEGLGWLAAVHRGMLDGATVKLERAFINVDQPVGVNLLYNGFGEAGDTTGWVAGAGLTLDAGNSYNGAPALKCIVQNVNLQQSAGYYVPIVLGCGYVFGCAIKTGLSNTTVSPGMQNSDDPAFPTTNATRILTGRSNWQVNRNTTLASPVTAGDTTVYVNPAPTAWGGANIPMIFDIPLDATDPLSVADFATLINTSDQSGNPWVFTLQSGVLRSYPAGTPVSNNGTLGEPPTRRTLCGAATFTPGTSYQYYSSGVLRGVPALGANPTVQPNLTFYRGTRFFKATIGVNLNQADTTWVADISFTMVDPIIGSLVQFSGRVSDIEVNGAEVRISVKSDLELLNIQMPRNIYQPGCLWTLYDSGCGLNKTGYQVSATASGTPTRQVIPTNASNADGYFDLGTVTFTSGVASGISRTIKSYADGAITLLQPLPIAPSAGDTMHLYPGCNKTQGTCQGKFNNLVNFKAFPYLPTPETGA